MKRTRHSPEQIVTKLHQAATELAGGKKIEEVCKNLGIPGRVYTEVPPEGIISGDPARIRDGVLQFGGAMGMQGGSGAYDAGSWAQVVACVAEVFGVERDGVHQGQERDSHCAGACWAATEFCRPAFLGAGLLGINGRQERGCRAPVYPRPGKRRPTS